MQHETSKGHDFGVRLPLDTKEILIFVEGASNMENPLTSMYERSRLSTRNRKLRSQLSERLA